MSSTVFTADRVDYFGPFGQKKQGTRCELTIRNVTKEDSGNYSVRYSENPCHVSIEQPPTFQEGATVTLQCSTRSYCEHRPEWSRSNGRYTQTSQGNSTLLTFSASWMDDGQTLSCRPPGVDYPCAVQSITLAVEYSPKDTQVTVSSKDIREGNPIFLTCVSKGNPEPSYTWFKNGQDAFTNTANLNFPDVRSKDNGTYVCQAQNLRGIENSSAVTIDVTYAPRTVTATPSLRWIKEGDEVTLSCSAEDSNPAPTQYLWFRNHAPYSEGSEHRFLSITTQDSNVYHCQASNAAGSTVSPSIAVTVHYGPRNTRVESSTGDSRVKVGHDLTLTCATDALPQPSYTWYHAGRRMDRQVSPQLQEAGRALTWQQINVSDAGEYMCQALNNITGQNSSSIHIDVLYPPNKLVLTMDSVVNESSLLTILCRVQSNPNSSLSLTWKPDLKSDASSPLAHLPVHNSLNSLSFSFQVSFVNAGVYTCRAQNSEGDAFTEQTLVVQYPPQNITVTPSPGSKVEEGRRLELTCRAQSVPVSQYTWFKSRGGRTERAGEGATLAWQPAAVSDAGQYHCRATNRMGEANSSAVDVSILYGPKYVEIIRMTTRGQQHGAVVMTCHSLSVPPIHSYTWFRQTSEKDKMVSMKQNYTVFPNQEGTYYCIAKNSISSSKSKTIDVYFGWSYTLVVLCVSVAALIFTIIFVLVYRLKRKPGQQSSAAEWSCCRHFSFLDSRNGTRETLVMEGVGDSGRSRENLSAGMTQHSAPPLEPPASQPIPLSGIHTVYSAVKTSGIPQQGPQADRAGQKEDSITYASLHFPGEDNTHKTSRDTNTKGSTECIYSKVCKPGLKEKEEKDYENVTQVGMHWQQPETDTETSTSDEEDVSYSVVSFPAQTAPQRRQLHQQHHYPDSSSSSDEEDYETQYSDIKI
ncbi:B-cell receptor CD22 [Megalops cyprinoides]|uniref:B-cell receptor CD22 n=1 Tax=Megalops cyprinoides TaxID=118141 RepID=UPI001864EE4A|nr:B-cell receptor CD22 [Megalops cyprinoides]